MENDLTLRQSTINGTSTPTIDDQASFSFTAWLASYWFILLIVLAILVVISVLICACVLKKHPRSHSFYPRPRAPTNSNSPDQGGSSERSHQSSIPTIPSLSADSTPIPSPHSSQHSMTHYNGSRIRRTSPHFSSTSSDTLRPDIRSESSNSSASLMGHSPTRQQERGSPMERRGSLPRRTHSGPMVRVTSMPDVKNNGGGGLRSAPSQVSVESSSNGKSGVSYKFMPTSNSKAFVEVGVTVHTPGDPDKAVRIATAAALAESARKLAQEAASFIDNGGEEDVSVPPPPSSSSLISRPYHPGSGRSSSFSQSSYTSTHSHVPPNTHTHVPPITTASLDNDSSSVPTRVGGGSIRGGHYSTGARYVSRQMNNESNYDILEDDQLLGYDRSRGEVLPLEYNQRYQFQRTRSLSFQRGRPRRSSLDNYPRHEDLYLHGTPPRERLSSLRSTRDTIYRQHPHTTAESSFYSHTGSRTQRLIPESTYSKGIPYHLTAAGRHQQTMQQHSVIAAGGMDKRGVGGGIRGNDRGIPPRILKQPLPADIEEDLTYTSEMPPPTTINKRKKLITTTHHHHHAVAMPTSITMTTNPAHVMLPQSPSTSASLSSTHSSQIEELSPPPQTPHVSSELYNGGTYDDSSSTVTSRNDSIPYDTSIESSLSNTTPDGADINHTPNLTNHTPRQTNHAHSNTSHIDIDTTNSNNTSSVVIKQHRKTNPPAGHIEAVNSSIEQLPDESISRSASGSSLSQNQSLKLKSKHSSNTLKLKNTPAHLTQSKSLHHSSTTPSSSHLMSSPIVGTVDVTVNV